MTDDPRRAPNRGGETLKYPVFRYYQLLPRVHAAETTELEKTELFRSGIWPASSVLCKLDVEGSNPFGSINRNPVNSVTYASRRYLAA